MFAIALSDRDFDPTEVVEPWRQAVAAGLPVVFATGSGEPGVCDPLLLTGVVFGQLGARAEIVRAYEELRETDAFRRPIRYEDLEPRSALVLPGGHAQGMRPYLESAVLRARVLTAWKAGVPIGAICHGVLVLARTVDPDTGRSLLDGRRCTALIKRMEWSAWAVSAWKLGDYYRTYPEWVEDEVIRHGARFERGSWFANYDFVVREGSLVTARWPGDARRFGEEIVAMARHRSTGGPPRNSPS